MLLLAPNPPVSPYYAFSRSPRCDVGATNEGGRKGSQGGTRKELFVRIGSYLESL